MPGLDVNAWYLVGVIVLASVVVTFLVAAALAMSKRPMPRPPGLCDFCDNPATGAMGTDAEQDGRKIMVHVSFCADHYEHAFDLIQWMHPDRKPDGVVRWTP